MPTITSFAAEVILLIIFLIFGIVMLGHGSLSTRSAAGIVMFVFGLMFLILALIVGLLASGLL